MKKIDLYLTAVLLVAGIITFLVGGFTHNDNTTDAGVITCIVSFIPILISSIIEMRDCR
jgi:hypothetical protein